MQQNMILNIQCAVWTVMYPSSHRVGDTGVHYGAQGRLLGYIFGKITDLEFEIHKNIYLYEFLAIERARTNIC